ncbi:hypothetical protein DFH07DRAFT_783025 [Mycena maculata]|uniref:DUF6589 domain-containing protein n=1 Tax=Mycena maculata TaxID=230809 RepID=A0AAD7HQM6_9AGAR|nr:hypothetical protein DFH07DRAFT_783025 [Mycena maculata]
MQWTKLNSIANNSYGPAAALDPSALSKSATATGAKRPSNLKKVDFFPTSRSMKLFFEARVLDCWRISFNAEDILEHFSKPMPNPPDLHVLWATARKLVTRYASQKAYDQAIDTDFFDSAHPDMKIPLGTPWVPPAIKSPTQDDDEMEPEGEEPDQGDRVMANKVLFLQDMGWWIIADHAVPDGEIGRIWEIMKIWIFSFCGSANRNYTNYLLETYCLHRYEASKDFSNAIFNNSLINPHGRRYIECDWIQEDYNKWLEEMVERKGGDFDDHFYRHTLAPNVMEFLHMKSNMESSFKLKPRGKTHGAPHLQNEFQQLLRMHKEDQRHLYRPGRTMGHASINFYAQGNEKLEESQIDKFIRESTAYSDITKDVLSGEEHDHWDEEMQKKIDNILQDHDTMVSDCDSDNESGAESDAGDDAGEDLGGIDYSDDSEKSDDEEMDRDLGGQDESDEDLEGQKENEELSEMEEEEMDQYVPPVDGASFESDG